MGEIHEVEGPPCRVVLDEWAGGQVAESQEKVEDGQVQEDELLQRCRMRLDYLQNMTGRQPEEQDSAQTELRAAGGRLLCRRGMTTVRAALLRGSRAIP